MSKGRGDDKERWAFEMPKELSDKINEKAKALGLNASAFIRMVLIEYLQRH